MKQLLFIIASVLCFYSCSSDDLGEVQNEKQSSKLPTSPNVQLSVNQAKAYASLFYKGFAPSSEPEAGTRGISQEEPIVKSISYLIEGNDTLLYAINYADDKGFVLLAGANNAFPIIAHNDNGNVDLKNISKESPLYPIIEKCKQNIKKELANGTAAFNSYYDDWKDLGKNGYEYEVELMNGVPRPDTEATRGRRTFSTNKPTIYPRTGKELDAWQQRGGFNFYAEKDCPIGCPAIAIGMLMYDTSNRFLGNFQQTFPLFSSSDTRDITDTQKGTRLAQRLRQIADSIPNYTFSPNGSGANARDILKGLHRLGYTKAEYKNYEFEELYRNLTFDGFRYFGTKQKFQRGVLLASSGYPSGHIWFCDGYYEQGYVVTKKRFLRKTKRWNEYEDCLYMNWGWGKDGGNGWYTADGNQWYSREKNKSVGLNIYSQMFINLSTYELPRNH